MADDLDSLARDLMSAAANIDPRKLVQVEAFRVKQDWQAAWSDIRGMPHIGRSVTYDTRTTAFGAEAEIGPDPERTQGPLDNIVEFGSSAHGPLRPVTDRLRREAGDRLERYLAAAVKAIL